MLENLSHKDKGAYLYYVETRHHKAGLHHGNGWGRDLVAATVGSLKRAGQLDKYKGQGTLC